MASLRLIWLALCLAILPLSRGVARTWHVDADPGSPVDRIGTVVLQAVSGDTVLVGPGTYFEHIPLVGKSLVLRSTAGAAATILDGSVAIEGREGSIGYLQSADHTEEITFVGFTLTRGQGTLGWTGWRFGGALAFIDWPRHVRVEDCVFVENRLPGGGMTGGGAVYLEASEAMMVNCQFRGNAPGTYGMGGDLLLATGQVTIDQCSFDVAPEATERGVCIWSWADLVVTDCEFRSSQAANDASIVSLGAHISLLRNRFIATNGRLATTIHLSEDAGGIIDQEFRISENLFWNANPDEAGWHTALDLGGADVRVQMDHNTFAGCGVSCYIDGPPLECHHNIFYKSRFNHRVPRSVATCNCVSDSVYWQPHQYSQLECRDMVFADPLFCSPDTGDFHISNHSLCAPEHSPNGCGLIGLFAAECDLVPVRESSWGQIKARFR